MASAVTFPVYRKYPDGKTVFKIRSATEFEEVRRGPGGVEYARFEAKILPDRQLIADMIDQRQGYWTEATEAEFENLRGDK